MRFRSTGLGTTELRGYLLAVSTQNRAEKDVLAAVFQTTEPVQWQLGVYLEPSDIPKLAKILLKPSLIFKTIQALIWVKKTPKEPEDLMKVKWDGLVSANKPAQKAKAKV